MNEYDNWTWREVRFFIAIAYTLGLVVGGLIGAVVW